jgi:hypothetical protein
MTSKRRNRDQIDRASQQVFEEEAEFRVPIERCRTFKLDNQIDIAPRPRVIACDGAEDRQSPYTKRTKPVAIP